MYAADLDLMTKARLQEQAHESHHEHEPHGPSLSVRHLPRPMRRMVKWIGRHLPHA